MCHLLKNFLPGRLAPCKMDSKLNRLNTSLDDNGPFVQTPMMFSSHTHASNTLKIHKPAKIRLHFLGFDYYCQ